jgi:hypothetical protein
VVLDGINGLETRSGDHIPYAPDLQSRQAWEQRRDLVIARLESAPAGSLFIDFSADPCNLPVKDWKDIIDTLSKKRGQPVYCLSSDCRLWQNPVPRLIYWPYWLFVDYQPVPSQRQGRFSCLNRRTTEERSRVMARLLDHGLLCPKHDVYSIRWPDKSRSDFATHPDDWPNDHTINHPAWATHSTLVIETCQQPWGIITEKTRKSFESQSGAIFWNSTASYQVLGDFGFDLDYAKHADTDPTPLIDHVRALQDPADCQNWYHNNISHWKHNRSWLVEHCWQAAWLRYLHDIL